MKLPLKLIIWEDAYNGDHEWFSLDDVPEEIEPMIMQTVGFELRRNEHRVMLCMSYGQQESNNDTSQACDIFCIPIGMIIEEKTLNG